MSLRCLPILAVLILLAGKQIEGQEAFLETGSGEAPMQAGTNFNKIPTRPSFPYADGWLGGDGPISVQLSDTRVLWILSDSYVSHKTHARKRKSAWTMVNNVVAISEFSLSTGSTGNSMHYYWRRSGRDHRAFFAPDTGSRFFWPVLGILRSDTVFVLMNAVEKIEDADPDEIFNFRHRGICLAVITGLEQADPLQWDIRLVSYSDLYPEESFMQAGAGSDFLYVFKHVNQESFLTRIPLNTLLKPQNAMEYLAQDGSWKKGSIGADREILFTGQANGSLDYYPDLGYWLYVYGPNFLSNEIRYRTARQITGPWSPSRVLYRTPEQTPGHPAYDARHFCYLARAHSSFYDPLSKKLLLTYDCNSTDFFHAAGSDFIYIPRVLVLDVPEELK